MSVIAPPYTQSIENKTQAPYCPESVAQPSKTLYTRPELTIDVWGSLVREKLAGYSIRLMGVQAIVVIALSLAWGLSGFHNVLPVLLGGLVSMIPNTVFAYRFFASGHQGKAPQKVIKTFYLGEILKLATTAGLALWMLIQYQVAVLPFLTGLVGATLGLSLAPILVLKRAARVRPS